MIEVIPSINVPTFEEVQERIKKVEFHVAWAHLDVTDGMFSKHLTWHNPADLPSLDTKLNIEVHLMVQNPEEVIERWLVSPVKRIIIHIEATHDLDFIIQKCHEAGVEIGLAINPETFWGKLEPWFSRVDMVQVLAVHPGPSGQKLSEDTFDKIRHIRDACPSCIIEIDGGMNPETARVAREAGVNIIVAGSYILNSSDIKQAIYGLVS